MKQQFIRTFDLQIRGNEVRYDLPVSALFHALNFAFKQVPSYDGLVGFRLHRNAFPLEPWFPFAMREAIWGACCGTPERMNMYLGIVLPVPQD